ncbi:MAG: hypothetical protein V1644_02945 [Candidatus Micrarchaeota archaeon]
MKYVYQFELKHKKELENLLTKDPYADDSFARLGYILKESAVVGLKGGNILIHFRTENVELAKKLIELLKTVPSCKEATKEEMEKVVNTIEAEENNATEGFGSIFS